MNLRVGASVVSLASVVLAACAGGGAMQAAREARYQGDRTTVLKAVLATVQARYEVMDVNPETGLIVTRDRWYEKDGTFEDKKLATDRDHFIEDGSYSLRYDVRLRTTGLEYRVEVTPVIAQVRVGYAAPFPLEPDSLEVPGWITGKTEILATAIYDALGPYRVATVGTTPASSTTAQR